jgi:molybdopterin-dependent oxidoreductase alpha subunit
VSDEKIKKYSGAAGGWDALNSVAKNLRHQGITVKGAITLLQVNQPTGFDCPGCAWPDKEHTSTFEYCENGAKAVAFEATSKRVTQDFFAAHSVTWLTQQSDHFLEDEGRVTHPMRYDASTDHYVPISWDDAFALISQHLRALPDPNKAAFYTSGRTSNEAAFLYQLFVRAYGTNNFPDCSNMCHEPTSVGLSESIGLGKGTVTLDDFELADSIFIFGQNPGTNHPRMLGTLRKAAKRGANIIAINPLRERGLERFTDPQDAVEMLTGGSTQISSHYCQPKVGGDFALLMGMFKYLKQAHDQAISQGKTGLFDQEFIRNQTQDIEKLLTEIEQTDWADICAASGLTQDELNTISQLFATSERAIFCWGMGITQHRHGVATIHMLSNLLLARGHIGRAGAGACPVRGHSNVQGDRTMGIYEKPAAKLLDRLDHVFGIRCPREHGLDVIGSIDAMYHGKVKVFFAMGGNFVAASPDSDFTYEALRSCDLSVQVSTKLNRSHLICGREALILPCLGRTEIDIQAKGSQAISVEDSMSNVHLSMGRNAPASPDLLSESAIVAKLAQATLPSSTIPWNWYIEDYDRIRDAIAQVFDDFYDFNGRVHHPGGFHIQHPAARYEWRTKSGKAMFHTTSLAQVYQIQAHAIHTQKVFTLTTMRAHDQYNTTIYGLDDRYRGVFGQRRVLFIHDQDLAELGFSDGQWVDIESLAADQKRRVALRFKLVKYDIPRGCLAAYYPETNVLVALDSHAEKANTPASKSIPVILHSHIESQKNEPKVSHANMNSNV